MGAVAVDLARRTQLSFINCTGRIGTVDKETCPYQFIVAAGLFEFFASFANPMPVRRWLKHRCVVEPVEAGAQP